MAKQIKTTLSTIVSLGLMAWLAYYILVCDNVFHASVSAIIAWSHQLSMHVHLVVLAFVPIYIAIVIFGTALLGVYLSKLLDSYINNLSAKTYQPVKFRL